MIVYELNYDHNPLSSLKSFSQNTLDDEELSILDMHLTLNTNSTFYVEAILLQKYEN